MASYEHPLLSDDELTDLTGYDQPARQIRWLQSNRVGYAMRPDGRPRTTWGAVDHALIGNTTGDSGPDLSWLPS